MNQTSLKAPQRSSMPDLSGLFRHTVLNHMLSVMLRRAGVADPKAGILLRGTIRLIDKALEDYELSRACFSEFVNDRDNRKLSLFFRAIGHMENCLASLVRALRYIEVLDKHPEMKGQIGDLDVLK